MNLQDKFYFCLSQMSRLSERPGSLDGEVFRKLFEVSEFSKMDHKQQRQYIAKMTTARDIHNQIAYAKKEGLEQGLIRGREEGVKAKALETARNLKAAGVDVSVIAQCTGLTFEVVNHL